MALEDEILAADIAERGSESHADTSLLGGWGGNSPEQRSIHIPSVDAVELKLKSVGARAVRAAAGDESVLRLALLKCSEDDEKGIAEFCEQLQQVTDVTAGRIDKGIAAMKLITGQGAKELIEAHSFEHGR